MRQLIRRLYILLAATLCVLLLVIYLQHVSSLIIARQNARELAELSAELLWHEIEHWLERFVAVIEGAASFIERRPRAGEEEFLSYLKDTLETNANFLTLYYTTADNSMINASGWTPPPGFDLTKRPWYTAAVGKRGVIITEVFLNASGDHQIVTIAAPIFDAVGNVLGVVGGDLSIKQLGEMLSIFHHSECELSFIVDENRRFILDIEATASEREKEFEALAAEIVSLGRGTVLKNIGGEDVYLAFRPLEKTKWYVATAVLTQRFAPAVQQLTGIFLFAMLLTGVAVFFFGYMQYREVLHPLFALERAVAGVMTTELSDQQIPPSPRSYYEGLVHCINALLRRVEVHAVRLQESQEEQLMLNEELIAVNDELNMSLRQEAVALNASTLERTQWQALFYNTPDAAARFDANGNVVDINAGFGELFGYELGEIEGVNLDDVVARGGHTHEAEQFTEKELSGQSVIAETVRYNYRGEGIDVEFRGIPVVMDGEVRGGFAIYTDIRARKQAEQTLRYLSEHDQLTGLCNRRRFELDVQQLDTVDNLPLTIIMVDADGLKLVNDAFGHQAGDELLKHIATCLTTTFSEGGTISRIGGDEFVLLMPGVDEMRAADMLKKAEAVCESIYISGVPISVSFGMATKTLASESMQTILKQAEDRMYGHKLVESRSVRGSMLASLRTALEERTHETKKHSERLLATSVALGHKLGLSEGKIDELRILSSLHDIGKIGIPDRILNKPGSLTPEEWEIMKRHPEIGYRIANSTHDLFSVKEGILYHHERWDGKGYPIGLKGNEIPLTARIIAVADAYDAMISDRPYRQALSREQAVAELEAGAGTQFDPSIVPLFLEVIA